MSQAPAPRVPRVDVRSAAAVLAFALPATALSVAACAAGQQDVAAAEQQAVLPRTGQPLPEAGSLAGSAHALVDQGEPQSGDVVDDEPSPHRGGAAPADRALHYLRALEHAWNSGDTGPVEATYTEACAGCGIPPAEVREWYAGGGRAEGVSYDRMRVDRQFSHPRLPDREVVIVLFTTAFDAMHAPDGGIRHREAPLGQLAELHVCPEPAPDGLWGICHLSTVVEER